MQIDITKAQPKPEQWTPGQMQGLFQYGDNWFINDPHIVDYNDGAGPQIDVGTIYDATGVCIGHADPPGPRGVPGPSNDVVGPQGQVGLSKSILHVQELATIRGDGYEGKAYLFHCPACGNSHWYSVCTNGRGLSWTFNGNMEAPTFSPSLKMTGTQPITDEEHATIMAGGKITPRPHCCHLHMIDGKIHYCGDCTHAMAGKVVDMVEW